MLRNQMTLAYVDLRIHDRRKQRGHEISFAYNSDESFPIETGTDSELQQRLLSSSSTPLLTFPLF